MCPGLADIRSTVSTARWTDALPKAVSQGLGNSGYCALGRAGPDGLRVPDVSILAALPVRRGSARQTIGTAERWILSRAMDRERQIDGLQRVILNERSRLLRFLVARGAGDEAEDVLQDLWQRVAALPGQPIADPLSYLFRAAENLMRDRRRSEVSRERRQQDWQDSGEGGETAPVVERTLIAREQLRAVETELATLDPRVQQVFRRYRLAGETQSSIAQSLGVSLSSVEKDLHKAHRTLSALKARFDAE